MSKLRTTAPASTNKNYISTEYGGYNKCIVINKKTGSVIPNCTGYAWGAWREMLGYAPELSRNNAERWIGMNKKYKTGKVPKLGAVACYLGGKEVTVKGEDGAGHVGIVVKIEKRNGSTYVTLAQSNYNGTRWEMKEYKNGVINGLTLQGYIYLPDGVLDEGGTEEVTTETALKKMAEDVIAGKYGNGTRRKELLYKAIQAEVNILLKK